MKLLAAFTVENWPIVSGGILMIGTFVFKWWSEWAKDRRDRDSDKQRLEVLRDIANSNLALVKGQVEQNGKLSSVAALNATYHGEVIRALQTSCRAQPVIVQQNNPSKSIEV